MALNINMEQYWKAVVAKDAAALRAFFTPDACIKWHNTNEQFTLEEYIRANCEYPGEWVGEIERLEDAGRCIISVARVQSENGAVAFHCISFMTLEDGRIKTMDEYWGDDGPAPWWRQEKEIGSPIR